VTRNQVTSKPGDGRKGHLLLGGNLVTGNLVTGETW
jgi:hypothetical protein